MATGPDPFTACLTAAWDMFEANADLGSLVKVENRVKFDKDVAVKKHVSTGDKPEVRIIPVDITPEVGSNGIIQSTSSSAYFIYQLEVQIATGEGRLFEKGTTGLGRQTVLMVLWQLWRSCLNWRDYFDSMTWGPTTIAFGVHRVSLVTASIGVLQEDLDRDTQGWSSLSQLNIALNFGITAHSP